MSGGRLSSRHLLELRHLRYFLAVAEELNFGRAAAKLGIAQPNLSQQIKVLEEIVGASLFDRTQRSVQLTAAGQYFRVEASETLDHARAALTVAQRAGRGEMGKIAVGYVGSATYTGVLVAIMGEFRKDFPDVDISLTEMEMHHQLKQISAGTLDVGFIRPPIELPLGVGTLLILEEEVGLAISEHHPLAQADKISLIDLKDDTFITPRHPVNVSFNKHTMDACVAAGFSPRLGQQGADFVTIISMVAIGLGVALVPQSCRCLDLPGVRYKRLSGATVLADLSLAFRRSEPSPVARSFARYCSRFRTALRQGSGAEGKATSEAAGSFQSAS
jgi:DNA-binding transcriptional LysR family regulator